MAAGDRKVKIIEMSIGRANPVPYVATYRLWTENKLGMDVPGATGEHQGTFGTAAAWRAMTGAQMETQVTADVTAAANTPPRDSVT